MRNQARFFVFAVCLGSLHTLGQSSAEDDAWWRVVPTGKVVRYGEFKNANVVPDWSNAWGIGLEGDPLTTERFVAVSPDGAVRRGTVRLPGARQAMLHHAAVGGRGAIVVTGHAVMLDGSAQYFIARVKADGEVEQSLLTGQFAPLAISVAPDDSVWALGSELRAEEAGRNYTLVRHFAFGKGLIGEALDARSFSPDENPYRTASRWPAGDTQSSWLRCDSKQAYIYTNLTNELIEVNAATNVVLRWHVDTSGVGDARVVGFAVTESGRVFANLASRLDLSDPHSARSLFVLDKHQPEAGARWIKVVEQPATPVELEGRPASGRRIWGSDGERLVMECANEASPQSAACWYDVSPPPSAKR
jgi:hypothetical protein